MVRPSSEPVSSTPASTGTVGLLGSVRATQATASAKSSRTKRHVKSVTPTVVVATSIASLHHPEQQGQLQRLHPRWSAISPLTNACACNPLRRPKRQSNHNRRASSAILKANRNQ